MVLQVYILLCDRVDNIKRQTVVVKTLIKQHLAQLIGNLANVHQANWLLANV